MTIDADSLRVRLGNIAESVLSDVDLTDCITSSFATASKKVGATDSASFNTVAEQQAYDADDVFDDDDTAKIGDITDVIWHPGGVIVDGGWGPSLPISGERDITDDLLITQIEDSVVRDCAERSKGLWHIVGDELWLDPTPGGVYPVRVFHKRIYDADTVPTDLEEGVYLLAMACALTKLAIQNIGGVVKVNDGSQVVELDGGKSYMALATEFRKRFNSGDF